MTTCVDRGVNSSPGMSADWPTETNILTGFVFPTIAHRERESLTDIVELHLIDQLHVRSKADDKVGRYSVDIQ